jgi:hypothetical protein
MMTNSQIVVPQHHIPNMNNSHLDNSQDRSQVWSQLHNNARVSTEVEKLRSESAFNKPNISANENQPPALG